MAPLRRRQTLQGVVSVVTVCSAGCALNDADEPDDSPAESPCSATDPPRPTEGDAPPKPYPERPAELTQETVGSFVAEYESAYQYNSELGDHPNKIGRLNSLSIDVQEIDVREEDGSFVVEVAGMRHYSISSDGRDSTPETPTETPLPTSHGPFEATYRVSSESVTRDSRTVECW